MMCELPSNALQADEFLEHFDGFSIGSNDLTQLTLGLDRDSGLVAHLFDERNMAVQPAAWPWPSRPAASRTNTSASAARGHRTIPTWPTG